MRARVEDFGHRGGFLGDERDEVEAGFLVLGEVGRVSDSHDDVGEAGRDQDAGERTVIEVGVVAFLDGSLKLGRDDVAEIGLAHVGLASRRETRSLEATVFLGLHGSLGSHLGGGLRGGLRGGSGGARRAGSHAFTTLGSEVHHLLGSGEQVGLGGLLRRIL